MSYRSDAVLSAYGSISPCLIVQHSQHCLGHQKGCIYIFFKQASISVAYKNKIIKSLISK